MYRLAARTSPNLRCAVCHDAAGGAVACPSCGTLVHPGCQVGGCVTLGCAAPASAMNEGFARGPRPSRYWLRALLGLSTVALLWSVPADHDDLVFDLGRDLLHLCCGVGGVVAVFYTAHAFLRACRESWSALALVFVLMVAGALGAIVDANNRHRFWPDGMPASEGIVTSPSDQVR